MTDKTTRVLDFQDPGPLGDEMTNVPGMINRLTDYTLGEAHSPNRTLAFLGATAMLAHLTGRSYADMRGTRTNVYLIALGETGIGKEAPRSVNRKLADAIGMTDSLCDQVASGQALEELVAKNPATLFQPDEVETFIGAMCDNGLNAAGLSERIRRFYSASAGLYSVRATARHPNGLVVPYPHLTMFGTGTPEAFYRALNTASITNGLFGRCLVVEVPDAYAVGRPAALPLPADIVDQASALAAREKEIARTNAVELKVVGETPEASSLLLEAATKGTELRRTLSEKELFTARALVVRMNEKIGKFAMLHAISADPDHPMMTAEGVRWAARFVTHVTRAMLYEAQFHIAEGKFDALMKRFLGLLSKHGGSLDRRTIIRLLHIDHITFNRVVLTLHMCDAIIEDTECGKNAVYTLKNA